MLFRSQAFLSRKNNQIKSFSPAENPLSSCPQLRRRKSPGSYSLSSIRKSCPSHYPCHSACSSPFCRKEYLDGKCDCFYYSSIICQIGKPFLNTLNPTAQYRNHHQAPLPFQPCCRFINRMIPKFVWIPL